MIAKEIRQKFLDFFTKKGHKIIPAAPLVPENDPTTLFTSAGMQQLVPYLKGEEHPMGKRLVNSQPSIRLQDIEEVGDTSHTTFFEMLGNWSLGDYFKKEQLPWFFEFLTKELALDPNRLYVSVFEGTKEVAKDNESFEIWKSLGIPRERIFFYPAAKNWWSISGTPEQMVPGDIGGPDSEVFYDFGEGLKIHENSLYKNQPCHPNCQCGRFLEIGNSVFIQYEKKTDGKLVELPQKNVDFGGGLERLAAATSNNPDIFQIDLFAPLIRIIELASNKSYQDSQNQRAMRIIADHIRAAMFLVKEGLEPSNKQQGYILRRLIRRSVVKMMQLDIVPEKLIPQLSQTIFDVYGKKYFAEKDPLNIHVIIGSEINEFQQTIHKGTKLLQTEPQINGRLLFDLYQSYGFPLEITMELLSQWGRLTDKQKLEEEFNHEYKKHQELSRTASAGMFKGGLADHSETVTKYHTATHLLHAALRQILGDHVEQKGSNITNERLRFDFSHPQKLTDEEIYKIEELVNRKIAENLPVTMEVMDLKTAQQGGALGFFRQKYGDKVKVYMIGNPSASSGQVFSKEICGGPHVNFTGTLGRFKIIKEEAAGAGVRRIYGHLHSV